jgi:peptide/nickel transport system substrate-binding protein
MQKVSTIARRTKPVRHIHRLSSTAIAKEENMKFRLTPLVLLITILLVACDPIQAPAPLSVVQGGELVVALATDIVALDPAFAYDEATSPVVNQITEGLLKFNPDGTLAPNLAESWEIQDPLTYVYTLRQGVTFHDGSPLTADDVLFSLERARNPATGSPMLGMYMNVDRIEKVDDWTIQVRLKQPDALWQYVPATAAGHILSLAHYTAHKETFGQAAAGLLGTGPFKFVSWTPNTAIVLVRNDQYWDKANGGPYLDRVTFKIVPDLAARTAGFQTGELHMGISLGLPDLAARQLEQVAYTETGSYFVGYLAFNTQRPPFDNLKVRQALGHLLDMTQVAPAIAGPSTVAIHGPVPPALWTFERAKWQAADDQLPRQERDLEKARQLLAESGVADQLNGKTILVADITPEGPLVEAFVAAAAELGIQFEVKTLPGLDLFALISSGEHEYDIVTSAWWSDFPDPAGNLMPNFHTGGWNLANYSNSEVDRLLDEQTGLLDPAQRTPLLLKAQQMIMDDVPWVGLWHPKVGMALNKAFTGYMITPLWSWDAYAKDIKQQSMPVQANFGASVHTLQEKLSSSWSAEVMVRHRRTHSPH